MKVFVIAGVLTIMLGMLWYQTYVKHVDRFVNQTSIKELKREHR